VPSDPAPSQVKTLIDQSVPNRREVLGIPDRRGVEVALSFAETSKKDLLASRVLYAKKLYPQAVFELQQCVEKGVLAIGILSGLANPTKGELVGEGGRQAVFGVLLHRRERLSQLRKNLGFLASAETLEEGKELLMKLGLPLGIPDQGAMNDRLKEEAATRGEAEYLSNLKPNDLWRITLEFNPTKPPNTAIAKLLDEAESEWSPLDRFERTFEERFAPMMSEPETVRYIVNIYGKAFPEVAPLVLVTIWHGKETRYPPTDPTDYWDLKRYSARSGLIRLFPRLAGHAKRLCEGGVTGAKAAKSF
jgi:hypothetical protein